MLVVKMAEQLVVEMVEKKVALTVVKKAVEWEFEMVVQ